MGTRLVLVLTSAAFIKPLAFYNTLNGVAAISAHNVWTVGAYSNGNGSLTLVEHWNGTQWQLVASPDVKGSLSDSLSGISAITANNIWAVGGYNNATNN